MAAPTVPQAVQSCHELLLWLIPQLDKFPRARRFTLGERIERRLQALENPPFIRFDELTVRFDKPVLRQACSELVEELRTNGVIRSS